MLTLKQLRAALATLRQGLWPSALGPPPSAFSADDPQRQRTICDHCARELERRLEEEDAGGRRLES